MEKKIKSKLKLEIPLIYILNYLNIQIKINPKRKEKFFHI